MFQMRVRKVHGKGSHKDTGDIRAKTARDHLRYDVAESTRAQRMRGEGRHQDGASVCLKTNILY